MHRDYWWRFHCFFNRLNDEFVLQFDKDLAANNPSPGITVKKALDTSAEAKVWEWKKGFRKGQGTSDPVFQDYILMDGMNLNYDEVSNLPETVFQSLMRIINLRAKEDENKG